MTDQYQPISKRTGAANNTMFGDTTITTFNLYNLFDADKEVQVKINGEWQRPLLPVQLAKLSLAIQFELRLPEIIAVQEVSSETVLQQLADRMNEATDTHYRAISPPTSDRRGIQIGFLYDQQRVELIQSYQLAGDNVDAAFGDKCPNPGREPLVGVFRIGNQELTIINNHFKSNHIPEEQTAQAKQLLKRNLALRAAQARVVRDFANRLLEVDSDVLIMVAGDLNTSKRDNSQTNVMDPVKILEGIEKEQPLTNLLPLKQDIFEYTYIWEGENEILDHMLVSPALLNKFSGVDGLHFNAAYPEEMGLDKETAVRSSDHDPLEARFQFKPHK